MNRWRFDKATRDRIWSYVILLALAAILVYSFVVQILHHP